MNARRSTWTAAGLLLSLTAGSPAIADDTEFMLLTPGTDEDVKPNILFILDTSGSMADEVITKLPYDSTNTYATGTCDATKLYWTDVEVTPDCSDANTRFIAESSFVCDAANGRLSAIGSFTDTMAQYRETGEPEINRWQEILPGDNGGLVECQSDSGVHGDNGGAAGYLWASNGSDGNAFTNVAESELAWGNAPAAVTYTVYDGNYLNWKSSTATDTTSKMAILKAVTKAVLNSVSDVNVGVMRFNDNDGGPVIKAMGDLDTNRPDIIATIDSLDANGSTPLSETLYEAARYWRGLPAYYGENFNEHATDPAALESASPEVYRQPETNSCSKNFNVLLSDGLPNADEETPTLISDTGVLPGYSAGLSRTGCDGAGEGRCLDDVAEYLNKVDIDADLEGGQFVTTHTIGFAMDIPVLETAAKESGGRYFRADDVEGLTLALLNIISEITERSLSFTAPAISVNSFNRTQNLNDLYLTVFSAEAKEHWPGNLKKYKLATKRTVDADGFPVVTTQIEGANNRAAVNPATGSFYANAKSLWTDGTADGNNITLGGAAHEQPLPRIVYTNDVVTGSLTTLQDAGLSASDFGLTGAAGEPTLTEMIGWMRGVDSRDEDGDGTDARNAMGDALHSQPAVVVYGGDAAAPDVVVFTGTNDGYLHAIDADDGKELWAFVPKEFFADMDGLYFNGSTNAKHYGIDGDIVPVRMDKDRDGKIETADGDFVYLVFGLRRGGKSYYALDVTSRNSPKLLWKAEYPEFGQSWPTPVVTRVRIGDEDHAVVVVGGGYDTVHDSAVHPDSPDDFGAGIHMLDLATGARLWWAGPGASEANKLELAGMTRAIPTQVRVIDISGDGRADRMYAADLGGQIWRFDIVNGNAANELVTGGVIAQLGAEGSGAPTAANTRRFYTSPDVAIFTDPLQNRRFISISIGSGYRAHPLQNDLAADMFFSIRDPDVFNQLTRDAYEAYDIVTVNDLKPVNGEAHVEIGASDRGWRFELPAAQSVLSDSVTFDDSVFFIGFAADVDSANPCQPSNGKNFLYQVSIVNGDPVPNFRDAGVDEDPDAQRMTPLEQGGIAPTPTFLFPGSSEDCEGAECAIPPIFCVGRECFDPGFDNKPVRTLWTQDGVQ